MEQERPNLPWTPVVPEPARDNFNGDKLALKWHTIRAPKKPFYQLNNGSLLLSLSPEVPDSMAHSSMLIKRIADHNYSASTKLTFSTNKANEQAGLIMYRTSNSYYMLLKEKSQIVLVKKFKNRREIVASVNYSKRDIYLQVDVDGIDIKFSYGDNAKDMIPIGETQNLKVLAEGNGNRFNGPGVGIYASSNGKRSKKTAKFDWFEYKK